MGSEKGTDPTDGGAYTEFRNYNHRYRQMISSSQDYLLFKEMLFELNAINHWFMMIFILGLIIIYGMNNTYYECVNVYLHFSLAYMEADGVQQTMIAVSYIIGNALILCFIFWAYGRGKKQDYKEI